MSEERTLSNTPDSNEIWAGIGGHFDSFGQILAEFLDNSVANLMANQPVARDIQVRLFEKQKTVLVEIEDTGSGIKNLDNAFTLGGKKDKEGPLNEHGFGMKHALASANPNNNNWAVFTRTMDQFEAGRYELIESPYEFAGQIASTVDTSETPWPGKINGAGTLIRFECERDMFETLGARIPGPNAKFEGLVGYLREFLGYLYSGLIQNSEVTFGSSD